MKIRKGGIFRTIDSKDFGLFQKQGWEKVVVEPLPKLEEVKPEPVKEEVVEEPIREVVQDEPIEEIIDEMPKAKRNKKNK